MYSLEWAQTVQYFAPLIPRAVRHISAQSESKVAPTQSKQGNNEWGVEAMLFCVVARHKLPIGAGSLVFSDFSHLLIFRQGRHRTSYAGLIIELCHAEAQQVEHRLTIANNLVQSLPLCIASNDHANRFVS